MNLTILFGMFLGGIKMQFIYKNVSHLTWTEKLEFIFLIRFFEACSNFQRAFFEYSEISIFARRIRDRNVNFSKNDLMLAVFI